MDNFLYLFICLRAKGLRSLRSGLGQASEFDAKRGHLKRKGFSWRCSTHWSRFCQPDAIAPRVDLNSRAQWQRGLTRWRRCFRSGIALLPFPALELPFIAHRITEIRADQVLQRRGSQSKFVQEHAGGNQRGCVW